MSKKKDENYLDYIYDKNPEFQWKERENGIVVVEVKWTGFFNRIAQKVFNRPEKSEIALDEIGSFVWHQIDGKRDLYEISNLMKEEFGEDIEPVYERLFTFIGIMNDHNFIVLKGKK